MESDLARVEALIYVTGDAGITADQISKNLNLDLAVVNDLIKQLAFKYQSDADSALQVVSYDHCYQITTKIELDDDLKQLFSSNGRNGLSQASLEGLTIIAYNQPITRVEVDEIRGVNSAAIIQKLLKQGLVKQAGKKEVAGTPLLYKTTNLFLNLFGLSTLDELPPLDLNEE